MGIQNFITEFKKTFVYDLLSMTLKDEQLFEHFIDGDKVIWFKEQTRQMWELWQQAQKVAVPEGFVLVPMVPSERMINAVHQCYEGEAYLPYSLYSEFVNQAIIERMEAQEQVG